MGQNGFILNFYVNLKIVRSRLLPKSDEEVEKLGKYRVDYSRFPFDFRPYYSGLRI